ncbi:hypothetical protein [Caballeronia sp. BCC1704]|uniref:hypothetical protein n=1 Tax=Caballeronia sp. BCC1704 TaxID=2676300 RepID=UPI00158C611B|nr:hypothetical protein [Caballeronia sp. BCC1704]
METSVELRFLMAALACWRFAALLATTDGPGGILRRLRRVLHVNLPGRSVACTRCVSVWVAVPFAWFVRGDVIGLIVAWLALCGVTALIEEWSSPAFEWREVKGDELLQHETRPRDE